MRPRLARRGELLGPTVGPTKAGSFNAAPARSPGRTMAVLWIRRPGSVRFNAAPARSPGRTTRVVTGHFSGDYVPFRERHVLSACPQALSSGTILRNPFDCSQFGLASGSQSRTVFYLPRCQRTSDAKKRSCSVHHLRTRAWFQRTEGRHLCAFWTRNRPVAAEVIPRPNGHRRAVRPSMEVSNRLPGDYSHGKIRCHAPRRANVKMLLLTHPWQRGPSLDSDPRRSLAGQLRAERSERARDSAETAAAAVRNVWPSPIPGTSRWRDTRPSPRRVRPQSSRLGGTPSRSAPEYAREGGRAVAAYRDHRSPAE